MITNKQILKILDEKQDTFYKGKQNYVGKYVGQRVPRVDAYEKVTGRLKFGADVELPNQLISRLKRSTHAHAKITRLDTSKAEALPGVVTVATGKEFNGLTGCYLNDSHVYAIDRVLWVGDIVAAVAAETAEIAEKAVELIEIEYEDMTPVFDAIEAMKPDAPLLHPNLGSYKWLKGFLFPKPGTNIANHFKLRKGDVEKGFAEADYIFEDTLSVPMVQHTPMESHACVVQVEAGNQVEMWACTQGPFLVRQMISDAFNIPLNKIRVHTTGVGGGFGAKLIAKNELYAIPLALKSHRPVKMAFNRSEEFLNTFVRQGLIMKMKTGVKKNGKMVARKIECIWDGGAFCDYGVSIARSGGYASAGPYDVENLWIDSYCVYTNKPSGGAYRGFGVPEAATVEEQQIDMIAERLGIPATEMRRINFYHEGDTHATGMKLHSVGCEECLDKVTTMLEKTPLKPKEGKLYGAGQAHVHKFTAHTVAASAVLKINEDNSILLYHAVSEIGQGSQTVMQQIVSEVLDVPIDQIQSVKADTHFTPYAWQTAASKATFFDGNACKYAAENAKKQLIELAAIRFDVPQEDVEFGGGKLWPKGKPESAQNFAQVSMGGSFPKAVFGHGIFTVEDGSGLDEQTGQGNRCSAFWMFGGQGAEVYVDTETGEVELARMVACHDVGTVINPTTAEGQLEGSVAQGLGIAMFEEMHFDEKGKLLNDSFTDYHLPTTLDMPLIETDFAVNSPHKEGPYGAKGMGEPALGPTAAAIANAVYNACGVRLFALPLTSERVWKALKDKEVQK